MIGYCCIIMCLFDFHRNDDMSQAAKSIAETFHGYILAGCSRPLQFAGEVDKYIKSVPKLKRITITDLGTLLKIYDHDDASMAREELKRLYRGPSYVENSHLM